MSRRLRHSGHLAFAPLMALLLLAGCDSPEERTQKHYERGIALLEEGAPEKAMLEFRNALELNEQHLPTHLAVARLLEARGELQAAFARYALIADIDPNQPDARVKLTRFHLLSGDLDKAKADLEASLRLAPERAEVQALRAAIALREDDAETAGEAIAEARLLDPNAPELAVVEISYLMRTDSPAAALGRADQGLEADPRNLSIHILKLQLLEQMQDSGGVGDQLATMVEAFPEELRFRESLSRWALANEEDEVALTQLRALVDALPGNSQAVSNLIRFVRSKSGDEAARAELQRITDASDAPFELELMLAQFDVETGSTERAMDGLRALIEREGGDPNRARLALARLLEREQKSAEADALVKEVLATDPNNVDALVMQISRLLDRDDLTTAAQKLRLALNEAPDDVRLLLLAGRTQELLGNIDLASDRLARAVRLDEYRARSVDRYVQFLLRTERYTAAEIVLAEAARRYPEEKSLLDLLGFTRVRLENWPGAMEAARGLERLDPDRARQLRAAVLIAQEKFDEGAGLLRDLPEDARQRSASVAALVQTYMQAGQAPEAVAFLDGLIEENPQDIQALGIRGNLHAAAGELDEAEARYRQILELDPGNGGAHSALARVAGLRGDNEESERIIRSGLNASPQNVILLARMAQIHEVKGEFDAAIDVYEQLYAQVPSSLLVANNLASLLSDHRADDPAAVARAYEIATRLGEADQPQYRDTFGWTRYLKGEYDAALERVAPVAEALPDNPWVRYHLGMIYKALNRPEEARAELQAALEKSGAFPFPPADTVRATLAELGGG